MVNGSGKGWIGLDLGYRSIVIAQLERSGGSLRIAAASEMPRTFSSQVEPPTAGNYAEVSKQELATARLLAAGVTGRTAACVLPISVAELTHASLPPGEPREQYAMVANELGCSHCDPSRQFDYWPSAVSAGEKSSGLLDVNVIAVDERRAAAIAETVNAARFDCRVLDGLPHAVARAVQAASPNRFGRPLAAVHLAHDEALFVLSRDGVPVFTRQFRNAGMHRIVSQVSDSLGLLAEEAVHVLRNLGLPEVADGRRRGEQIQDVLAEIAAEPLGELAEELRRTLSYLATSGDDATPKSVCVLGEGAAVRNLAAHLAAKADVSVWNWSLPGTDQCETTSSLPPAVFAVASALSSLAWES